MKATLQEIISDDAIVDLNILSTLKEDGRHHCGQCVMIPRFVHPQFCEKIKNKISFLK